MNIRPDDPRITAYQLGELSSQDALAVEHAAAADPAVRLALRETGNLAGFLHDTLGPAGEFGLRPAQREAIRRAGRTDGFHGKDIGMPPTRRPLRSWLTGLGAAAVVAFAAVLLSRLAEAPPTDGELVRKVALLPQPGPAGSGTGTSAAAGGGGGGDTMVGEIPPAIGGSQRLSFLRELEQGPLPSIGELPQTTNQSSFSHAPQLRLPVVIGTASGTWVRRWISERDQLPPARAVRVEEMINRVTLATDHEIAGLKLGLHQLDWQGSRWIAVQLIAGGNDVTGLSARSEAPTARRVVGSFGQKSDAVLPSSLAAGRATLVLLEFDGENTDLGSLIVEHHGGREILEVAKVAQTAQPGMRHVVATAIFGRWLRGEAGPGLLQQALAMATTGEVDVVHRDDQQLIRRAIALAAAKP